MQHVLFELLENAGLLKGTSINIDKIARAKRSELIDIAQQSAELTSTSSVANVGSIFSHTASLSLGGSPTPCRGQECRMKMVRELIQFAAFYSDRVFINNNLSRFADVYSDSPLDEARCGLHDELEIMATMRPLIEEGLIVPVTPTTGLCYHCLGKRAMPDSERRRFDRALRRFTKRYAVETKVSLECDTDGCFGLHTVGDSELVEHGSAHRYSDRLKTLVESEPQLASRLKNKREIILPKALRKKWEVDDDMAHELFDDVGFEMAISQCLKTSIVTSRPIHVEILNDFVRNAELNRRNFLIQQHLTCILPFLNNISAHEVLELRNGEADSFICFRQAFAKAVDEHIKAKSGNLTEQDAEAIFREVIEPELARLNRKVASASKSVFRKSRAGIVGWAAAISAGFYFGFVESSLVAAAKALGLTKVAADLTAGLLESKGEDVIRDENMYFLWKVRHRAERG